jgi:membrane associated rhomboid family serine protease
VLPLRDNVPTRSRPVVTWALIAANVLVWVLYQLPDLERSVDELAYHPCEVEGSCPTIGQGWMVTALTSMFMHGSWAHLLGNMLFLWVFGNNIEDRLGRIRFLPFYVVCGGIAGLVQSAVDSRSDTPLIGASGAIAGVLGAYILLYPRAEVWSIIIPIPIPFRVPAFIVLGVWFLFQFLYAGGQSEGGGGVADWAHVGGFVAGMLLIHPFLVGRGPPAPPRAYRTAPW